MGFRDLLRLSAGTQLTTAAHQLPVTSPYSSSPALPQMVITDLLSEDQQANLPMTRERAISIPAVSKARNLLVSTIARFPLVALRDGELLEEQPTFMYRTNGPVSPYERMVWTIDDAIFYGVALWKVQRGQRSSDGLAPILDAEWVPFGDWYIDEQGRVIVYDEPAMRGEVVLFNFPFEGLLNIGRTTLQGAIDIEAAWTARARNPIPALDLHLIDEQLTQEEVDGYVSAWSKARRSKDGAVSFTPPNIELKALGELKPELYAEGRNAIRTDVGSFLNVRASMLDGTSGIDSLTYTTRDGERNLFYDMDLPFWTDPIEQRLSLDDALPRGQSARFNKYEAYNQPSPTGLPAKD